MKIKEVKNNFTEGEVKKIENIIDGYLSSEDGINKIETRIDDYISSEAGINKIGTRIDDYISSEAGINKIETRIKEYFSAYLRILKAFLLGLGIIFSVIILSGLITKQNLFVLLHDAMFGTKETEKPIIKKIKEAIINGAAISYQRSFILEDITQVEKMLFYAEPGQEVKIFLDIEHHGAKEERHLLMVELDEKSLYDNEKVIKKGFHTITDKIFPKDVKVASEGDKIHTLKFYLKDFSETGIKIEDIKDKVSIDCIILVYGKRLDENE